MKRLPISQSSFEKLIKGNCIYVDKTENIYRLITQQEYYFLSRPRRFGKSLLISTLKEIFSGNKKLFENLWIEKSDYNWRKYPVIQLDFSSVSHQSPDAFTTDLIWTLEDIAKEYDISISDAPSLGTKLRSLVTQLSTKDKVVLLIDEYDYPLLQHLHSPQSTKTMQEALSGFFTVVKSLDAYCRAIFITGVSQFSKASIFSGMNNLNDISLKPEAELLLGYTEDEIKRYFGEYIDAFAKDRGTKPSDIINEMRTWYNGYCFSEDTENRVYNPYSVLYYLNDKKLKNYWFETGTPSFLINLIKSQFNWLRDVDETDFDSASLGKFDINDIPLIPVLFQTGYLTIKNYDPQTNRYKLGYPNEEVRRSFKEYLIAALSSTSSTTVKPMIANLKKALEANDIELFCSMIKTVFAAIPYQLHKASESYYHSLLLIILELLGYEVHSEVSTSKGRIDLTVTTANRLFIFEFKFNATAQQALAQIRDREYYQKYVHKGKPITLVGISFNFEDKELSLDFVEDQLIS